MNTYEDSFEALDSSSAGNSRVELDLSGRLSNTLPHSSSLTPPVPIPVSVQEGRGESTILTAQAPTDTTANALVTMPPVAHFTDAPRVSTVCPTRPVSFSPTSQLQFESRYSSLSDTTAEQESVASTDTLLSHIERKLDGINAPETDEFQQLACYVAFCDSSHGSERPASGNSDDVPQVTSGVNILEGMETSVPQSQAPLALSAAVAATEERVEAFSLADSSAFSTLSQHLAKGEDAENRMNSVVSLKRSSGAPVAVLPHTTEENRGCGDGDIPTTLPLLLPPPALSSLEIRSPAPNTLSGPPKISGNISSHLPSVESLFGGVPPPLPSRETPQTTKIVELRETSEAVERLVRAFALLRGHASSTSPNISGGTKDFSTKDTERLSSLRQQHGIGDTATVRTRQVSARPVFRPRLNLPDESKNSDRQVSVSLNEAAVEDAIMCLVMELMQRGAKQPFEENIERKSIQPSFETVDMDNFKTFFPLKSRDSSRTFSRKKVMPLSVFDGCMQAFAPGDTDASESLYHSILQALQKYVASHVATSVRHVGKRFPSASPHFAWVLQLDLLSVCMQALESRFTGERAGTKDNVSVWIQYEGPCEGELLARNAVHCLPFEALDAKHSGKHTFRLEYWVTKDKMWIVVEALVASIREGIVARSDGYRMFSGDENVYMDPNTLFPTRVPLFSLVTPDRLGKPCDEDAPGNCKATVQINKEESDSNFFQLESTTMELVAHAVSVVSTEVLEDDNRVAGTSYRRSYKDATKAIAEALCELLDDAGVRAAVKRRAKVKMTEMAERREVDSRVSRQEKERRIIETAEAQAELVVQRILQEIRVEEAKGV